MHDPNDGCNPNTHGAPWNEDDEGNCDCSGCRHRRRKEARDKYLEDNGPDYDDEQEEIERKIDHADFRRKERKEDALLRSLNKGGKDHESGC